MPGSVNGVSRAMVSDLNNGYHFPLSETLSVAW